MERKRQRAAPKPGMSSPPRSTKGGQSTTQCVPDIVTRTFDLVTSGEVIPYYILAAAFSFYYGPTAPSVPSPRPLDFIIVKILPLLYLMQLVRHPPENICPFHDHARRYILLGLVLSCIGLGFQAWKPDEYSLLYIGLSCLRYLCYSIAFFQYYQANTKWAKIVFPVAVVVVGSLIYLIQDPLPCAVIVVYSIFLTVLGFFALARLEACRTGPAYLGWAGVKLFALTGYMCALSHVAPSTKGSVSDTVISMTHYLAQLGIALSTYTIKLCPSDEPSTSCKSNTSGRSDSSTSVRMSRSSTPK